MVVGVLREGATCLGHGAPLTIKKWVVVDWPSWEPVDNIGDNQTGQVQSKKAVVEDVVEDVV